VADHARPFPVSDHCDGTRFFNVYDRTMRGARDIWRWYRQASGTAWPKAVNDAPQPRPPERVAEGEVAVTFLGHPEHRVGDGARTPTLPVHVWPSMSSHAWVLLGRVDSSSRRLSCPTNDEVEVP
jgi:hypothetical protein